MLAGVREVTFSLVVLITGLFMSHVSLQDFIGLSNVPLDEDTPSNAFRCSHKSCKSTPAESFVAIRILVLMKIRPKKTLLALSSPIE